MQKKRKASGIIIVLIFAAGIYAGYLLGGIFNLGLSVETFNYVLQHPFENYIGKDTAAGIFLGVVLALVVVSYYITGIKNYMHGKEFGSEDWKSPEKITKKYFDDNSVNNKIFSDNVAMSYDDRYTERNGNTVVVGGSGSGKSFYYVAPNLLEANSSFICTDPKGELLAKYGKYLQHKGYDIKVLNFVNYKESDCYNPFDYFKTSEDIPKHINNLLMNTTPKEKQGGDPFWDKYEASYLQALMYYVWMEGKDKNYPELLDLMSLSDVDEDGNPSELDLLIDRLEIEKGSNHPAVEKYRKAFRGAGDTIRSVIVCANSRLEFMNTPEIRRILSKNDIDFRDIGAGKNKDGKTKTALFFVIPSLDKTYNSIIGMAYTQLFQELYYIGDNVYNERLPIPIQIYMDEFYNVTLPSEFLNVISTCRSYFISINVILQNMAQIKEKFKDSWETIMGNCDTFLYLGGNEQSSHKYVSELLGKWTIDKQSSSHSTGMHGSHSSSDDVTGRELMTPSEIRRMSRKKCIFMVAGEYPVIDLKYKTRQSMNFKESKKMGIYVHSPAHEIRKGNKDYDIEQIEVSAVDFYEKLSLKDKNVKVYTFNAKELVNYDFENDEIFLEDLDNLGAAITEIPEGNPDEIDYSLDIMDIVINYPFNEEQLGEVKTGLEHGLTQEIIKEKYLRLEYTAGQMSIIRTLLEKQLSAN